MQHMHDRYCDESHTPRQACNDALVPPELRARPSVELEAADAQPESAAAEQSDVEPASPAMRDALATAAAVAGLRSDAGDSQSPDDAATSAVGRIVLLLAVGALACVAVFFMRRSREVPNGS
jgi:hypothetical protein